MVKDVLSAFGQKVDIWKHSALSSSSPLPEFYIAYPGVNHTRIIKTPDGLNLYGQWWEPQRNTPTAIVLLLHGTAAHAGVYAPWAMHLVENGYAVFAYDMRGWGQSQGFGRAGFTCSVDDYVNDVDLALEEVTERYPGVPVYLQGESLGASVALQWSIRGGENVAGLILNAPPVIVNLRAAPFPVPDWLSNFLVWNAGLVGRIAPNAPVYPLNGLAGSWIWNKAIFDSLVRSQVAVEVNVTRSSIAASYITNLQKLSSSIRKNVDKIKLPMIVLQGSNDHLVSAKAAEHLTKRATSSPHRQWHLYQGRSHCALHDTNKEDVWRDIISWLGTMTSNNH
jgi:acylglycerol lipase